MLTLSCHWRSVPCGPPYHIVGVASNVRFGIEVGTRDITQFGASSRATSWNRSISFNKVGKLNNSLDISKIKQIGAYLLGNTPAAPYSPNTTLIANLNKAKTNAY